MDWFVPQCLFLLGQITPEHMDGGTLLRLAPPARRLPAVYLLISQKVKQRRVRTGQTLCLTSLEQRAATVKTSPHWVRQPELHHPRSATLC